jgi:hypothetical protein
MVLSTYPTRNRQKRAVGIIPCHPEDQYGRKKIPGVAEYVTERRRRRWAQARVNFHERPANGRNNPLTIFHLLDMLANIEPDVMWTSAQLTDHLNEHKPNYLWDAITVGRILNECISQWDEANNNPVLNPLTRRRSWDGNYYQVSSHPAARQVLLNLIDDLVILGEEHLTKIGTEDAPSYADSPLNDCPSISLKK